MSLISQFISEQGKLLSRRPKLCDWINPPLSTTSW